MPRAIYTVSPDGTKGLSVNFARIDDTRPGYGYKGGIDPHADAFLPPGDGIFLLDLDTGESKQILDYPTIAKVEFPGAPYRLSKTPALIGTPPRLGQHNDELLAALA